MTDPSQKELDELNAATEASMQAAQSRESLAGGTDASKLSQAIAPIPAADDEGLEHEADVMGPKSLTGD
jgi:hypothetical protein